MKTILITIFLMAIAAVTLAGDLEKKLITACQDGNGAAVAALLKKGASPNARTTDGFTALMYAVEAESTSAVQALLQAKVAVNAQSTDGYSALMIAADKRNPQVTEMLIRAGANSSLKNKEGATAYDIAVEGHSPQVDLFKPGAVTFAPQPQNPREEPPPMRQSQSRLDVPQTPTAQALPPKNIETPADVEDFFGRPEKQVEQPLTVDQKLQRAEQKYVAPVEGETPMEHAKRLDHYIKIESKKIAAEMAEEFKREIRRQ